MRKYTTDEIIGQVHGLMTIVEVWRDSGEWWCLAQCRCGTYRVARHRGLYSNTTGSCGCELRRIISKRFNKHGASRSQLYKVWSGMKHRCCRDIGRCTKYYLDKGISICSEWNEFEPFQAWSLQNGYEPGLTIDRIDGDGDYSPDNCRWVTRAEQCRNTSRNNMLCFNGKTMCLKDWADSVGLNPTTLTTRLRWGWSIQDALTRPLHPRMGRWRTLVSQTSQKS